jgi:hypothetical protein
MRRTQGLRGLASTIDPFGIQTASRGARQGQWALDRFTWAIQVCFWPTMLARSRGRAPGTCTSVGRALVPASRGTGTAAVFFLLGVVFTHMPQRPRAAASTVSWN